jgi:hypothetical protein
VLIKTFLTGVDEHWLRQQAEAFCEKYWTKLMRPAGVLAVAAEVNSGAEVTICSASPALVLQPWADKLGIKLIGTQLEVKNGKLTGRITGNNCRCAQKVARLEKVYGNLNDYHLRAWGDTRGDHELLAAAQIRTGDTSTIRASAGIHRLRVSAVPSSLWRGRKAGHQASRLPGNITLAMIPNANTLNHKQAGGCANAVTVMPEVIGGIKPSLNATKNSSRTTAFSRCTRYCFSASSTK